MLSGALRRLSEALRGSLELSGAFLSSPELSRALRSPPELSGVLQASITQRGSHHKLAMALAIPSL
eukprot:15389948-Alexandrium_andersonii.AAC.1